MKWVARVISEPFVLFLVLAAALCTFYYAVSDEQKAGPSDTILVSRQRLESLIMIFERTWQRAPTQQELGEIIDEYVKEEVYYREALAMDLDRDDTFVRRRLRQKLEFLAEDMADAAEPTEEELQHYLDENSDSFRIERRATFFQVYLSRDRRGEDVSDDAVALLAKLRDGSVRGDEAGDPSLLQYFHQMLRESEISNIFGGDFGTQLIKLDPGLWHGPLESAYGMHLVLLEEKTKGRVPKLDEAREAVHREWIAARRAVLKEEFFQALLSKYEVVVEELASTGQDKSTQDQEEADKEDRK